MNKKIAISILAIIAIVIAFGAYYYLQQTAFQEISIPYFPPKKIETPPITSEQIDTSDWKVYRNEKYGFEVRYPREWFIFKEQEGLGTRTMLLFSVDFRTPDEQRVVGIGIHDNPSNLPLDEWMDETGYKQVVFEFASTFEEVTVDGQAGRKYSQVPLLGSKTNNYIVPFKNRVYLFRSGSETLEFDKIVNSFKFIK